MTIGRYLFVLCMFFHASCGEDHTSAVEIPERGTPLSSLNYPPKGLGFDEGDPDIDGIVIVEANSAEIVGRFQMTNALDRRTGNPDFSMFSPAGFDETQDVSVSEQWRYTVPPLPPGTPLTGHHWIEVSQVQELFDRGRRVPWVVECDRCTFEVLVRPSGFVRFALGGAPQGKMSIPVGRSGGGSWQFSYWVGAAASAEPYEFIRAGIPEQEPDSLQLKFLDKQDANGFIAQRLLVAPADKGALAIVKMRDGSFVLLSATEIGRI